MEHQVTLNIPDAVYQGARQIAKTQGVKLENVLVGMLRAYWSPTHDLLTETGKLAAIAPSIESTDWWDVEGDKEWDAWTP
ncbi:MAG: hypothetical protein OXI61_09940 [Candidatus Poribacteria bacterium]|nr:hypothetical protein [Candidatus Poribacteria bacterium]